MIQLARIEAEIASWPFWSEASIKQGLTALRWDACGTLDRASCALYAALEEYLRLRCGGASLETLRLIRDRIWRDEARTQERSLLSVLRSVAREPNQQADRLRRFTLAMPSDLLTAAAGHEGSVETVVPDELREVLQRGVAQVHVHLGACMSFATLWEHIMVTAGAPFLDPVNLQRGGPPPFGNGKEFRRWLVTAALVRATLAGFLYWQDRGPVQLVTQFVEAAWPTEFERNQHRLVLDSFLRGSLTTSAERAAGLYRRISGVSGTDTEFPSLADLRQRDPIRRWLNPQDDEEADTTLFRRAFAYIDSDCDPSFARLFWQYVRVRGQTYRYIVQESGTAGLDWFSRHFQRISGVRKGMSRRARMESAYELEGRHLRLSSLEVRETPEADPVEIREIVCAVVKARPDDRQIESGVVLHFKKEWRDSRVVLHFKKEWLDSRCRPHADPRRSSIPCRYGLYALHRLREVHAIRDAILKRPSLLNWLRGLDMCSEELSVPNWVLLPMLGLLRKQSQEIAASEARQGRPCEGLRMTLHCGEDFRSLNEGLRRLHEPIEFGYLQQRDRVGHALALGIDVDRFLGQQPYSVERAEDRLENLLWELSLYESAILRPKGDRRRSIEHEIQTLGRDIYGEDVAPQVHQEARALRMRGWQLDHWRYPRMYAPFATKPAERILLAYLCDPDVYQNGQRPVQTRNQDERGFLLDAQRMLRAAFHTRQITVEANPSSNLLIGNFSELAQLPIFQLAKPRPDESDLSVAIADDDPLTFATSLHQEYVYAYSALLEMGCTQQEALDWIDQRRRQSIDARFTLDAIAITISGPEICPSWPEAKHEVARRRGWTSY